MGRDPSPAEQPSGSQQESASADRADSPTTRRCAPQPIHCRLVRFLLLDANPTGDAHGVDFASEGMEVTVAIKRKAAHAGDLPIGTRLFRADNLDVVERLAARGAIGR